MALRFYEKTFFLSAIVVGSGTLLMMSMVVLMPILAWCLLCAMGITAVAVVATYLLGVATTVWKFVYRSVVVALVFGANKLNCNLRGKLRVPTLDVRIYLHISLFT